MPVTGSTIARMTTGRFFRGMKSIYILLSFPYNIFMAAGIAPYVLAKTGRRRISMKKKLLAALSASAILLAGCQTDSEPVIGVAFLFRQWQMNRLYHTGVF